MIEEEKKLGLRIVILVSGMEELAKYQKGLMGVLRKIEVDNCDPVLKENLTYVYELLSHLIPDKNSFIHQRELLTKSKQGKLKKGRVPIMTPGNAIKM